MIRVSMLSESFRDALHMASPALSRKGVMPVLSSYLVEAHRDEVRVSAMNMALGIRVSLGAQVEQGGREVLYGEVISDWVSKIGDGEMSMRPRSASPDSPTILQSGRSKLTMNKMSADDFPVFPSWDDCDHVAQVDAEDLVHLLKSAVISCAVESPIVSRPVLESVMLRIEPGKMVAAAADGFRMSYLERVGNHDIKDPQTFLIPRNSVISLMKLVSAQKSATIDIGLSGNQSQIMARFGPVEWVSGLPDGVFPDIQHLVPRPTSDSHSSIRFQVDSLSRTLAPLGYLSRQNNGLVYLDFSDTGDEQSPGQVHVTAIGPDRGSGDGYMDAIIAHGIGSDRKFAVSWNYLADVLGVLKGEEVDLFVSGKNTALLFRPTNRSTSGSHDQVIMPMVLDQ